MTTYIPFKPPANKPFTFQATIGGTQLFGTVPFNLYANRFYLQLKDGKNQIVVYMPLIASPDTYDINLAIAFTPGKLIYRASSSQFEAS